MSARAPKPDTVGTEARMGKVISSSQAGRVGTAVSTCLGPSITTDPHAKTRGRQAVRGIIHALHSPRQGREHA